MPIKKKSVFNGMYYFLLKFHWVLSFQIFICFTDSRMIFQFGLCTVWPHLNMCIRKYIYWTDRSCFCHIVIPLLESTPSLPLAEWSREAALCSLVIHPRSHRSSRSPMDSWPRDRWYRGWLGISRRSGTYRSTQERIGHPDLLSQEFELDPDR